MKGLLLNSINNKEKILIFYMDSSNKVTERYVRVIKMQENNILTYCYYRKKLELFI